MHNLQRASEAVPSMQSTPAATAVATPIEEENVWDVWPYCWAIDLYDYARQCFHSFHEKHNLWQLARHNRRAQQAFRARFWQQWNREGDEDELELRLV